MNLIRTIARAVVALGLSAGSALAAQANAPSFAKITLSGPGSTGDISAMSVTPSGGSAKTLAAWVALIGAGGGLVGGTASGDAPVVQSNGLILGSLLPVDGTTIKLNGSGQLVSVGGGAASTVLTFAAAANSYVRTPSTTAMVAQSSSKTFVFDIANFTLTSLPAASTYPAFIGIGASDSGSGDSVLNFWSNSGGTVETSYYSAGNGSQVSKSTGGALPSVGTSGELMVIANGDSSSCTPISQATGSSVGIAVPSGYSAALWKPAGGAWTTLGSVQTSVVNGWAKNTGGYFFVGNGVSGSGVGFTSGSVTLTDCASTPSVLANVAVAAGATSIPNDTAGNAYALGTGVSLVTTGGGASASVATANAAGIVKPDGTTITVNGSGVISSTAGAINAAYTGSYTPRTPAQRASYQVNVDDFCDPSKCGQNTSVGADFGSTWAAVSTVYPFLTQFGWGGLAGNMPIAWAQNLNYIGGAAASSGTGATTVTFKNGNNLIIGRTLADYTTGKAIGVITGVSGAVATISAGISNPVNFGDALFIEDAMSATAAAAVGATSIPVATNVVVQSSETGWTIYDGTTSTVVGTLAANSGGVTNSINVGGSGLTAAVASGDTVYIYDPTILNFLDVNNFGTETGDYMAMPYWQQPTYQSTYVFAGEAIGGLSCIPSGTTITSIDSTLGDAAYGQIKLSQGTTANCGYQSVTVHPTDAQAQTLSPDYLASGEAMFEAWDNGNPYKDVVFASHTYYLSDPLSHPIYAGDFSNYETIRGQGTGTMLEPQSDFGFGKAVLSSVSNSQTQDGSAYRDFTVYKATGCGTTAGCVPAQMFGLIVGQGSSADHVQSQGFWAGFALSNDHNKLTNDQTRENYCGVYMMYGEQTKGNQVLIANGFTSNTFGAICVDATNQLDSATIIEDHIGFSPYGFVKLAPLLNTYYAKHTGFVTESLIEDGWAEADQGGYMYTQWVSGGVPQSIINDNTIDEAWGNAPMLAYGTHFSGIGNALADIEGGTCSDNTFRGGLMFQDQTDAQAAIFCQSAVSNRFIGADSALMAAISGGATAQGRGNPLIVTMNGDGGGNYFQGLWNGRLRANSSTSNAIARGDAVAISSTNGQAVALTSSSQGLVGSMGKSCSPAGSITMTDPETGQTFTGTELCPVIASGNFVPVLVDPSNSGLTITAGTGVAPANDGAWTSASGWSTSVGTAEAAPGGSLSAGSNQVGYAQLGR